MSARPVTVTLHGHLAYNMLRRIAYQYALAFIETTATVREAPLITKERAAQFLAYKATLESLGSQDFKDLPPVPEPDWPVRHLHSDHVATKWKDRTIPGVGPIREVLKTKLRPGAKQRPTYSQHAASVVATKWCEEFLASIGVKQ